MVPDRQKVRTDGQNGRLQNYIPLTSSGDYNIVNNLIFCRLFGSTLMKELLVGSENGKIKVVVVLVLRECLGYGRGGRCAHILGGWSNVVWGALVAVWGVSMDRIYS